MGGSPEIGIEPEQDELTLSLFHPYHKGFVAQNLFICNVTADANIFLGCDANHPSVHIKIGHRGPECRLSPVKHTDTARHTQC